MKLSAEEIEEVVREVLFRIQPTKSAKTETRQATNVAGIEIGDRVVATAQISKIAEHTTVRIGGSAIVTPAASDMAAERRIVLERQTVTGAQGQTKLVHAVGQSTEIFAAVLSRQLKLPSPGQSQTTETAVMAMVPELEAKTAARGVLLTADVEMALCLANRFRFVRAISVNQPNRLQKAMLDVAANLFVIDPEQVSHGSLIERCKSFFATPISKASDVFSDVSQRLV